MAPPATRNTAELERQSPIVHTPGYDEFIAKLKAYHERRGTILDPEPKIGTTYINLLDLFNTVVEHGGYDKVSEEKKAWTNMGDNFGLGTAAPVGFSLKSLFYKYLAAYEISTVHNREPPPKEILEDTTAKGGGLLTRTVENYRPPSRRETSALGDHSEASGDDGTPSRERNASEETPGSGGRVTRGLRHAPPQRVLFQPETQSSRVTTRGSAALHTSSPQPNSQLRGASTSYNPSSNIENHSAVVANYEPRPQMPLTLRPIITPGNNPKEFEKRQQILRNAQIASNRRPPPIRGLVLPGKDFDGPNIYVRCLCSLKSGIREEQGYALHHLVKISMERGDKYKFEAFPGLAEALVEKMLEVSSLFYLVEWHINYMDEGGILESNSINGVDGTPDILQRIQNLAKIPVDDNIQTEEFSDALLQINEAALTMRNMVMLEENAFYASELRPLKDFLSIALNLPELDSVIELRHYALDIAEQITKYLCFDENDPLYFSLLAQLRSQDRGAILTALRAISRISMNLDESNLLKGVPADILRNIIDWTLLNDEDLAHACLDFLYQYTAVVDNVDFLINELDVEPLVSQLTRLLTHGVRLYERDMPLGRELRQPAPESIASLPKELLVELLKLSEPERSSQWLKCLFEEDREESITQIALWQAYQAQFTTTVSQTGVQLLPAAEFIKNVSTTFADKAAAQVQSGAVQKFIIKGIRMRSAPVDLMGVEFRRCLWRNQVGNLAPCGQFFMSPENMYHHILKDHLQATELGDGKYENSEPRQGICQWDRCHRFKAAPASKLYQIASHIKVHLPPSLSTGTRAALESSDPPPAKKIKSSYITSPKKQTFPWHRTAIDSEGNAAGIPLSAVLVLRNLARNLPKIDSEETTTTAEDVSWTVKLFKPVEPRLFEVMAHNGSLTAYMSDLIGTIRES